MDSTQPAQTKQAEHDRVEEQLDLQESIRYRRRLGVQRLRKHRKFASSSSGLLCLPGRPAIATAANVIRTRTQNRMRDAKRDDRSHYCDVSSVVKITKPLIMKNRSTLRNPESKLSVSADGCRTSVEPSGVVEQHHRHRGNAPKRIRPAMRRAGASLSPWRTPGSGIPSRAPQAQRPQAALGSGDSTAERIPKSGPERSRSRSIDSRSTSIARSCGGQLASAPTTTNAARSAFAGRRPFP